MTEWYFSYQPLRQKVFAGQLFFNFPDKRFAFGISHGIETFDILSIAADHVLVKIPLGCRAGLGAELLEQRAGIFT